MSRKNLNLIGAAYGMAAADDGCARGPVVVRDSRLVENLQTYHCHAVWQDILVGEGEHKQLAAAPAVAQLCLRLAELCMDSIDRDELFAVIGGDHSCAIGTWSGASERIGREQFGLIWFDAHLDANTPESSPSGNIHGMPVACLLGQGLESLTRIVSPEPKLLPENLFIVGIRSYDAQELQLLTALGVRVYFMTEVMERGLVEIFQEIMAVIEQRHLKFGISLDLDGIDPADAPGTGTPVAGGLNAAELLLMLQLFVKQHADFMGIEITEFNPQRDQDHKTRDLISQLLTSIV